METKFSRQFRKQFHKVPREVKDRFFKRLDMFILNPFHPLLNNHALTGEFDGYRSINVNGDWRAVFREVEGGVVFEALGTHSQLYR